MNLTNCTCKELGPWLRQIGEAGKQEWQQKLVRIHVWWSFLIIDISGSPTWQNLNLLSETENKRTHSKITEHTNKQKTHHKAHMHISSTDKSSKTLTHLKEQKELSCSRIHRSFLSDSFSLPLSLSLLATSVSLLLLLPNYTWLLLSHSIHSSYSMPALSSFPPTSILSLPYFSQALLISVEPSLNGEQPFYIIT